MGIFKLGDIKYYTLYVEKALLPHFSLDPYIYEIQNVHKIAKMMHLFSYFHIYLYEHSQILK